ncbi:SDR family NAD(P)-dependent oxidoreductase [Rhodococcus sp. NPDC003318]|uniref:SDR family NAD(P)-dependent oxidoreductase n=1 Tax=Rhodococcus sp. NPDC003318 TaxID=3364503 RepID=UPI0036CFB023
MPGQVAVVTAAGSGIGKALAHAFAVRGLNLAIADIDENALRATRDELTDLGTEVVTVPTDVTSSESVEKLAGTTLEHFGTFDVVCNNVGAANSHCPSWEISPESWQRLLSLNLWSVINGIRAFVPHLAEKNSGHVLNTASMSGLSIIPGIADYVVTKHAVVALTETLSAELNAATSAVGATVLCPGIVRTPMSAGLGVDPADGGRVPSQGGAPIPRQTAIDPGEAAETALAAVEAGYLYAVPAADPLGRIRPKVDRLLHEVAHQPWQPPSRADRD